MYLANIDRIDPPETTPGSKKTKIRVLLIEDDSDDTLLIRKMLEEASGGPFALRTANRLSAGLEWIGREEIDIVLLDLSLPDSRGRLDTLTVVHASAGRIPVVVLTGTDDEAVAMRAVRSGAQDYLFKGRVDGELIGRSIRYAIERKQAEEEKKSIQAQLVQSDKMSALGTMTAGIAHELNNPLMGILNQVQYCLKHTSGDDRRRPVLEDALREVRRCISSVEELLTFSHTGKEGKEADRRIDCEALLKKVLRLLAYRTLKEKVDIAIHKGENPVEILGKEGHIQQVFINVLSNALDALEEAETKRIQIHIRTEGEFVHVCVSDTGRGILPEHLPRIFEPFFTTKSVGKGTGLGLSISRSILQDHGGEIVCESKMGLGTRVTIMLPASRA